MKPFDFVCKSTIFGVRASFINHKRTIFTDLPSFLSSPGYSAVAADLPVPLAVRRSVAKLLDAKLGRATLDPAKRNRSRPTGMLPTEMVALACQGGQPMDWGFGGFEKLGRNGDHGVFEL